MGEISVFRQPSELAQTSKPPYIQFAIYMFMNLSSKANKRYSREISGASTVLIDVFGVHLLHEVGSFHCLTFNFAA